MKAFKFLNNKHNYHVILAPERYTPEYYDNQTHIFTGVTPLMFEPNTFNMVKCLLFRHIETGLIVKGPKINETHPMFNFEGIR